VAQLGLVGMMRSSHGVCRSPLAVTMYASWAPRESSDGVGVQPCADPRAREENGGRTRRFRAWLGRDDAPCEPQLVERFTR
jgi:hypothetical protein